MWPALLLIFYCLLIVLASLVGGWLPSLVRLTHTRMQLMMSLVSGLMLGVALLHMLPHAAELLESVSYVASLMLVGLLVMFFLLRLFHVHQHGTPEEIDHERGEYAHELSWMGLCLGLAVHTLLDGVALAASVVAQSAGEPAGTLLGLGTFLAVVLHKPLDALSITSLMHAGGWTGRSRSLVNAGFALMCPLGAALFWLGTLQLADQHNTLVGCGLAFSAGFFICIALSDLLPEVRFHRHDRIALSASLLLGVGLAVAVQLLPAHWTGHHHHGLQEHHGAPAAHGHDDHPHAGHPPGENAH